MVGVGWRGGGGGEGRTMTGPKAGGVWGAGGERSMNGADQGRLGLQARANAVRGGGWAARVGGEQRRPPSETGQDSAARGVGAVFGWRHGMGILAVRERWAIDIWRYTSRTWTSSRAATIDRVRASLRAAWRSCNPRRPPLYRPRKPTVATGQPTAGCDTQQAPVRCLLPPYRSRVCASAEQHHHHVHGRWLHRCRGQRNPPAGRRAQRRDGRGETNALTGPQTLK